jgi:hypothetical protein
MTRHGRRRKLAVALATYLLGVGVGGGCKDEREKARDRQVAELHARVIEVQKE